METPLTVSESQDGAVPKSLTDIIFSLQDHIGIPNRNQLISGLFYLLMQECGYELLQPAECDDWKNHKDCDGVEKRMMTFNLSRLLTQASLVAPLLESPNGPYKLPLKLVGVEDYRFKLLISPSADDLIVANLLVRKEDIEDCFSIALRVSTFVPHPKSDDIAKKFADLKTLSVIFKDNIAHKGRSAVLNAEGIVNNSLVGLMDEVKHKIVKVLPVNDLLNLSSTCQSMLTLKRSESVWKALLWRDFHHKVSEDEELSVNDLIAKYQQLRDESRTVNRWIEEIDDSYIDDNISFDEYMESRLNNRESSFDFHPYFLMNIHNELRTTNTISLGPIQSATLLSDYESHTRIENRRFTDTSESNK